MPKKDFRPSPAGSGEARYPSLDDFDAQRRSFLARLGAVVIAAGPLGSLLSACDDNRIIDGGPPEMSSGVPDMTPAPLDAHAPIDGGTLGGVADIPAARLDIRPPLDGGPPEMSSGIPDMPRSELDLARDTAPDGLPFVPDAAAGD